MRRGTSLVRTRWAAIGAAVAVSLGGGGLMTASAAITSGERDVFVAIAPCRLFDTRPGPNHVGSRSTPIGTNESYATQLRGAVGNCNLPLDATAVSLNVTSVNPSAASYLTVYPTDVARPLSSNLNWTAGSPPDPNKVDVKLAADGRLSFYNASGTVDLVVDAVGYYTDHNHDDRYYTKAQTDSLVSGHHPVVGGSTNSSGSPTGVTLPTVTKTLYSRSVTTPAAGVLDVRVAYSGGMVCTVSGAFYTWITVDGTAIAGSVRFFFSVSGSFDNNAFLPISLEGLTAASVGAGAHTIAALTGCSDNASPASWNTGGIGSAYVTVLN